MLPESFWTLASSEESDRCLGVSFYPECDNDNSRLDCCYVTVRGALNIASSADGGLGHILQMSVL